MSDELVPGVHTRRQSLGTYSILDGGWPAEACMSMSLAASFGAIRFEVVVTGDVQRTLQRARALHDRRTDDLLTSIIMKGSTEDDARITFYAVRIDG